MSVLSRALMGNNNGNKLYSDDVFSTYLYTGNGSTQTINNGIDLAGKGGLVWIKDRTDGSGDGYGGHRLFDTARGVNKYLRSSQTDSEQTDANTLTAFNVNGFSLGNEYVVNGNTKPKVAWTFRKAAKFFDCGTYVGNSTQRQIPHSLGVAPGMVIIKATSAAGYGWQVWHRSGTQLNDYQALLQNTSAYTTLGANVWGDTAGGVPDMNASTIRISSNSNVNNSGVTYVWYAFAHDTATDGIIQCGSFTTDGSGNATVNLGWEPQYVMVKSTGSGMWSTFDTMRGATGSSGYTSSKRLQPNSSAAEDQLDSPYGLGVNATGFTINPAVFSTTFIYLAIRRTNKPPTTGTQVYNAVTRNGNSSAGSRTSVGFPPDLWIAGARATSGASDHLFADRLRGALKSLGSTSTSAEGSSQPTSFDQDGITYTASSLANSSGVGYIDYFFRRAPGVFDVVAYTGTGSARTVNHSLGVAPELMIVKARSDAGTNWAVYSSMGSTTYRYSTLQNTVGGNIRNYGPGGSPNFEELSAQPTASVLNIASSAESNASGRMFICYLWASMPGISKVGSYTGNGSSINLDMGFSAGCRFFMCKRTDSTGDWFVYDTTRGIVAGNDPHLSLNTTAAEVTTNDSVDPYSQGLTVNQVAATNINVSAATYIYLAFA